MKYKIITLIFIILLPTVISFSDNVNADLNYDEVEINVSIIQGTDIYNGSQFEKQNITLNYSWFVENTEYKFKPRVCKDKFDWVIDEVYDYLNVDKTDVLIQDGGTWDQIECSFREMPQRKKILREQYKNYIDQGGGYIGECFGSIFPLGLFDDPETPFELHMIEKNSFLEDMQTSAKVNMGAPTLGERVGIYVRKNGGYLMVPRKNLDPKASGELAYVHYNEDLPFIFENNQSRINGVCFNLTNLDKTHPILKDFWGDSLFMRCQGGSVYMIEDEGVSSLATYPADIFEGNESQQINAWSFLPKSHKIYRDLKMILRFAIIGLFGGIEIKDLPSLWQDCFEKDQEYTHLQMLINLISSPWTGWTKTDEIIETGLVDGDDDPKPAIIAFNYQNDENKGRLILSGPHRFMTFWYDGEIINNEQKTLHARIEPGLYHWENKTGDWIDFKAKTGNPFYSTDVTETNHTWFFRREVAWASSKVPNDNHLPPAYNRSQVVDIYPSMQTQSKFPIYCAVETTEEESWDEVDLTLYYKLYDDSQGEDPGEGEWIPYDTIHGRPYTFEFDTTSGEGMGDGEYIFCSVLKTKKDGIYTCDEFPPGYDARVYVNGDISAEFEIETKYPYTKENITFNSDDSSTKPNTTIASYHWLFGDGNESSVANPSHTYNDDGIYTVNLTVTNNLASTDYTIKNIRVHNRPPEPAFEPENNIVFINEKVNFTDNSSDIDGSVANWYWDFGDGTNSTIQNTNHTFTESGYYKITLEATDDDNSNNKTNRGILVINSLVNQTMSPQNNIWNNVQDAVDNSSINDLIYVENGTFSENIIINKSISLMGEDKNNVIIQGSIVLCNPYDYELPKKGNFNYLIIANMTGNELLMHFNNDSDVGENYSSSDLVVDYSGENNNGTNNGAYWTTSTLKGAGAFDFDGIDDSINLSSIPGLTGENVTVSAWVLWTNANGLIYPIISQSNATSGYSLYINNSTMKPCFQLDDDIVVSSVNLSCNEWHYIAGTHNESVLKVYVDGVLRGSINKTGVGFDTNCFIGFDNDSNYFSGRIDEVAVWNRTLSDDEIRYIYESNYGIKIEGLTLKDSNVGVTPCNHSQFLDCYLINHSIGVLLNNSIDVIFQLCNISDTDIGIEIYDSNPEIFDFNVLVDCVIDNVSSAILVNGSSNLYIVNCLVNGSKTNLSISDCDFENISVIYSNSMDNKNPDKPCLSGPSDGDINTSYTFSAVTNDSNDDQIVYWFDWGDGNNSGWLSLYWSNETVNASHSWMDYGAYDVRVKVRDIFDNESLWSDSILFKTELLLPLINSVNNTPDMVGFGGSVNITANVTDDKTGNYSGIKIVKVNISYPDNTTGNFTMEDKGNNTYEYVFSDTWLVGQYNYSIWAMDNANNTNFSTGYSFNVSAQATISVCTINESYGNNETVNLTDPPSGGSSQIGYKLLDDGKVLHIWNKFDSYYFDTGNGVQLTNHYNEYWSHNVLMLGYYDNDMWNLIYRSDNLSGFNKNIETDNESFVNATLWKDLSYKGFDFRLAIRYYLGVDDYELTVIPYIKNIGDEDIPYNLGFAWEINDIRVDMTYEGDFIKINDTYFDLNESVDLMFKNMSKPVYCWNETTNETYVCDYESIPFFSIMENKSGGRSESLSLRWDENLNYKVQVKSRDGEYNAHVTLAFKIGTLNSGQEKYTTMFWHDTSMVTYYFDDHSLFAYWKTNPDNLDDGSTSTNANTDVDDDQQLQNSNTCPGTDFGTITKVEIRVYGKKANSMAECRIDLKPKFSGGEGDYHEYILPVSGAWSNWFDITSDTNAPSPWTWSEVQSTDLRVYARVAANANVFGYATEVRVTYTPNVPMISDPIPADGSDGVSITPVLNITVGHQNGYNMNITWLSNSSGNWQVFGTNNSVGNGTYHQMFSNATVNGQWWYWKVNVSVENCEDVYNESSVFSFYTGYQSKIKNTGSTDIMGYMLIQVQYYNETSESWIVADDTINETTPRTINGSEQFGLDTIFNGNVNTTYLINNFGNGTYQVYAAFRDPDGDVLVCDNENLMEDSYQFTVSTN